MRDWIHTRVKRFIPAGIILLVIFILIPLHHEIGYLELLIPEWYVCEFEKYAGTSISLVPHFRTDLYTRTGLVYQKNWSGLNSEFACCWPSWNIS
jgi:hypothetical protein